MEPEEQKKLEIRRQKQAAHSAQIIYVLQHQVERQRSLAHDLGKTTTNFNGVLFCFVSINSVLLI